MLHNDEQELRSLASINSNAEERIYRRVDMGMRMGRVVYALFAFIVAVSVYVTVWTVTIKLQANHNTNAIRQLWEKVYGYQLPE